MKNSILEASDNPRALETLYRSDNMSFEKGLREALVEQPEALLLQAWSERLFFQGEVAQSTSFRWSELRLVILIALLAGTIFHRCLPWDAIPLSSGLFFNAMAVLLGAVFLYFSIVRKISWKVLLPTWGFFIGTVVYINFALPEVKNPLFPLMLIHGPILFAAMLCIFYLRGQWFGNPQRMDFVRYCGEAFVFSVLCQIGGTVFILIMGALLRVFGLIGSYKPLVQVATHYGGAAIPLVATFMVERVVAGKFRIAPMLSKAFVPLFLLLSLGVLVVIVMGIGETSVFKDRDFLIVFNVLLILVLGMAVYSISERSEKKGFNDALNIALIGSTLALNLIGLVAIFYRFSLFGTSPNRITVLVVNLLVFVHLAGILWHYGRFWFGRANTASLEKWITGYLPAYVIWAALVFFGYRWIFFQSLV